MDAQSLVELKPNRSIRDFKPGDTVRVHAKVVEGERERIQVFEGVVIRIRRRGPASSFTVRRISHGVGVERIFPFHSPLIDKVEVSKVGKVRRAKLYYLRDRVGKATRIRAGDRSRFEALTAALPPEESEEEEEELVAAEGPEFEEGAEVAVEGTEAAEGDAEETSAEADSDASSEAESEAAEEVAKPEAEAEESAATELAAEEAAEEPAASEEASEEPAAPEEAPVEEEAPAEEPTDEAEAKSSDEKHAGGEADESKE